MSPEEIYENRKKRFLDIGRSKGFVSESDSLSLSTSNTNSNFFENIIIANKKSILVIGFAALLLGILFILI